MKERNKAIRPMLAGTFAGQDVAGWIMQEKFDGARAIWDGSKLWTRNGNRIDAPDWWTKSLPAGIALDGELWAGRGGFGKVLSILKKKAPTVDDWRAIAFVAFDAPMAGTFVDRAAFIRSLGVRTAETTECQNAEHAAETMREIVAAGGEGIVLRNPHAMYENKRSKNLLKMKPGEGA